MGFLRNLLNQREISRLEELIRVAPAPSLFVRMAHLYAEMGDTEKAQEIIRRGAELFPEHEGLKNAAADARRVQHEAAIQSLRARLEKFPSASLYARLAEMYFKDGRDEEALAVCKNGCRAYPNYGGLWAILGQIALNRRETDNAMLHLEKAVGLDKYNYSALLLYAEVCLRKNLRDKAKEALERILSFAPGDRQATQWLKDFDRRAKALLEAENASQAPPEKSATSVLAAESSPSAAERKKSSGVGTTLHVEIKQIRRVEGVRGSILIDPYGLVIASDLPEHLDEELVAALLTNISRTIKEHSGALTIGEFEDGILESAQTRIHVLNVSDMTMGVFATHETKAGLLQRAIHSFAEKVIEQYR